MTEPADTRQGQDSSEHDTIRRFYIKREIAANLAAVLGLLAEMRAATKRVRGFSSNENDERVKP